jgi:HAD superfamily hydrolase (TIGR01549 family)
MIQAVIFDFGQTLADSADGFRRAEKEAQEKIFTGLSITLREEFLSHYRRIRKEFHSRSNFSRREMWREVYYYYCRASEEDLLEAWEKEYWETVKRRTRLFPETESVLAVLKKLYRLALITNTQGQRAEGGHRIAQYPQLEKYFEAVVVAGEGGVPPKPHPEPFRVCLAQLGIAPAAAVYVGDDWRIDIEGARAAGLKPVWIQHHSVRRNWPEGDAAVPVITSLKPLLEVSRVVNAE